MTLTEINHMLGMDPERLQEYLKGQQLEKENNLGVITVEIPMSQGEPEVFKACSVSKNFCVTRWRDNRSSDFTSFRSELAIIHRATGLSLFAIKASKLEAYNVADKIENILDWGFADSDSIPTGAIKARWRAIIDCAKGFVTQS